MKINNLLKKIISLYVHRQDGNIISREELKNNGNIEYFGSEETVNIHDLPQNPPREFQNMVGDYHVQKPFICEIPECELIGPDAVGLANTGEIISETTVYHEDESRLERSLYDTIINLIRKRKLSFEKKGHEDIAFSLVSHWADNYFHWVAENLTRLEGFEHYMKKTEQEVTIFIPNPSPDWLVEWLDLLGYRDYATPWPGGRVTIDKLIIPSYRWIGGTGIISPDACHWLRDQALSKVSPTQPIFDNNSTKIYISREDTSGRRVINESELIRELSNFGFKKYILSKLSISEQICLFSQADFIIAPHGAGLVNMIWGTELNVIELFGDYINTCYFSISESLDFNYEPVFCEQKDQGIYVDVNKVADTVLSYLDQ